MDWVKGILGWGIVIYAIMYLFWSATVIYGFSLGIIALLVRLIVLYIITAMAARALHFSNWKDVAAYALGWAGVAIVLDAVFLVPFAGWALYASWSVWFGYGLIILFPVIAVALSMRRRGASNPRLS